MILAVTTLGELAQTAGIIVAALLAAAVLLARSPRVRAAAMLAALVLTPVLLVANIWSTPQFEPLRERAGLALAAGGCGLVVLALAAFAIRRWPELLALAAAAALPFRVPIESGGDTANLLIPLYVVIAAGVLAYALPRLRAPRGLEQAEADDEGEHQRGPLEWLLAGTIVLYAVQATYTSDFDGALAQTIFFYVPFALLYALLVRIRWTAQLAGRCLLVLLVLAAAFVGIGFVEYAQTGAAAEPEDHQLQPVRVLLPRQLAVLRPEHLRALPRHRDARPRRGPAVDAARGARRGLRRRARAALGGARADPVAILVHRAARRLDGARRAALGGAAGGGGRRRVRPCRRARRARRARRGRARRVDGRGLQRPLVARAGRHRAGARPSAERLGRELVQDRVPQAAQGIQRPCVGCVAHDPDHRRRRAGPRRPRPLPRARRLRARRCCCAAPPARSCGSPSRPRSSRSSSTRCSTRRSSRIRSPGRCWRSARRWRGSREAARGARGARARRRRGVGARPDVPRLRRLPPPALGPRPAARRHAPASRTRSRRRRTRSTSRSGRCCRSPASTPTGCSCSSPCSASSR